MNDKANRVRELDFWRGPVAPRPVEGGMTNANFIVRDRGRDYFVRVGEDMPVHGIVRSHETAASKAACEAGISPRVVHARAGILVLEFISGRTLTEKDVRRDECLDRILPLIRSCHRDVPRHFRGAALMFWVFQVIRDYAATLREGNSRMVPELPILASQADALERAVGQVDIVFGHNDLLAANFIDDGERLWLVDFDYAGFNSPLFDLGGLASNSCLDPSQETRLLECYFEEAVSEERWISYQAMKCASLLRESMWSMVSELHSEIDFDYRAYTDENLSRYESAMKRFLDLESS